MLWFDFYLINISSRMLVNRCALMTGTKALIFERWWICFSSNSHSMFMKILPSAWVMISYSLCIHTLYDDGDIATMMKWMCTFLLAFPKPFRITATNMRMKLVLWKWALSLYHSPQEFLLSTEKTRFQPTSAITASLRNRSTLFYKKP